MAGNDWQRCNKGGSAGLERGTLRFMVGILNPKPHSDRLIFLTYSDKKIASKD